MKIIQIVTQMEAGGAQRVAYLLGRELIQAGHTAELWFLYQKRPAYVGVPEVRTLLDHPPSKIDYLKIIFKLAKMLRAEQPDALITHTYYANVIGQCIGRMYGIKRCIPVQHNRLDTYPFAGRSLDWLLGTLGVYPVNIAVSDEVIRSAARHPRLYRRRLLKIHNGVPTPVPSAPPEKIRDRWNLPLDKPLLIHVGRTSAQKNPIFLLGVLARLPEAHLVLVGDGELRDELTREIRDRDLQDRVHCLGEVSPEKGHDLMSASNVFVFPSLHEAMPMALLEAMHLGIPIVASDIAPHRDLLSSSSILLRLDEPDRWVTEIGALLGGQQTAAKLQEEERSRVKDFTARSMASSYCKLLI